MQRKSNGFTIIELIAVIVIGAIIVLLIFGVYKQTNGTCLEYEDTPVTDCYNRGHRTTCESYIEKRCVKYDD